MKQLMDLIQNPVFVSAGASWLLAQVLKVMILAVKAKGFSKELLAAGGGMPSSHTATVTGLTVSAALTYGLGGFEFPMAFFFSMVVIYDAMNVRYETGEQGKVLNHISDREAKEGKDPYFKNHYVFKEAIGHTTAEIAAGLVLGICVAAVVCAILS